MDRAIERSPRDIPGVGPETTFCSSRAPRGCAVWSTDCTWSTNALITISGNLRCGSNFSLRTLRKHMLVFENFLLVNLYQKAKVMKRI